MNSELELSNPQGRICINCNGCGAPMNIGDLPFETGIGMRGTASVEIAVPEQTGRFEAWAGIDLETAEGSAVLRIYANGKPVFDSGRIYAQQWFQTINPNKPVKVCIPVDGVSTLKLVAEADEEMVLSDWADARFLSPGTPLYSERYIKEDTLVPWPPMGLNTWNIFGIDINETMIKEIADAMVERGYLDAGYTYLCLDDGWQDESGFTWDTQKFPSGMKALGEYIHVRGLKFGMYSRPMWVLGREAEMARKFAEWEIDFLKYDFSDHEAREANKRMNDALKAIGRTILFNACEWGKNRPWEWAKDIGAHSWRVTYDVMDTWESEKDYNRGLGIINAARQAEALGRFSGPGGWNDPDMLVVGLYGRGIIKGEGGFEEYKTQFSLWNLLAAPLFIGCDIRACEERTESILLNKDVLSINQDSLGIPGWRIKKLDTQEVWYKPLQDGGCAIGLLNCGDEPCEIRISQRELFLTGNRKIYNVWTHEDEGIVDDTLVRTVKPHETVLLQLIVIS